MILQRLEYIQHKGEPEQWEVRDLVFDPRINLIVGQNATGKTRVMNVLKNLAGQIAGKLPRLSSGEWTLTFETRTKESFRMHCEVVDGEVLREVIELGQEEVLNRRREMGRITSRDPLETKEYEPPREKLTVHVRRDKKEYPYLEELFHWADSYHGFMFGSQRPSEFLVGAGVESAPLKSLESVPHLLRAAFRDGVQSETIVSDMRKVGYRLKDVAVKELKPIDVLSVALREEDLHCEVTQNEISAGMFRALSAVVIVNLLLQQDKPCTLAIDDIGEGLDFERSMNLMKLLLKKTKMSDIQLLLTSNDRHLLNAVDVKSWNILERKGGKVEAFNYANSKEAFDDFAMTGLSNFDFLSGRMYKEAKARR